MSGSILNVNVAITGRELSLSCGFKWLKLEEPVQKRHVSLVRMMWCPLQCTQADPQASLCFYPTTSTGSGFVNKVSNSLLLAILLEECHAVDWCLMGVRLRERAWNSPKLHIKLQFVPDREHTLSPSQRPVSSVQRYILRLKKQIIVSKWLKYVN